MNITTKFSIFELVVQRKSQRNHQIQHIRTVVDAKFHLKQTILIVLSNLLKNGENLLFIVNDTRIAKFCTYHEINLIRKKLKVLPTTEWPSNILISLLL